MILLIADDDPVFVKVIFRFFSRLKYEVVSASTYAGALALAEERSPEVILLDGSLPDGNDAGFCVAIRSRRKFDRTALIIVSGDDAAREGCKADRFVLKGGPLSEIETAINETLRERQA
jgi:DNA-binding response OmpR family regulator